MTLQQKLIALFSILNKEILRFTRIWIQTILPPAITTTLYFIIFGNLIGREIGEVHGITYSNFIAPGLIMMTVINNSFANVVSSFFGAKFHGSIQEMLISPLPNAIILLGYVGGGIARGMTVGFVVTIISIFFTELQIHNIAIILSIVFLTSFLFSLAGFVNAVYARSFDGMNIIPIFILTPLTYLGGVFYSIEMLPEFWQNASLLNPILYMVNGFRYGFLGVSDINPLVSFSLLGVCIVILFLYSLHLLEKGEGIRD
jgi:ABC-2 type transport system permease protein